MDEIKLNMKNLTKEEREQLLELVEKANKKESKVWKPEESEAYYYIDNCGRIFQNIVCSEMDDDRYCIGNCFKTKEEAEFSLERKKVIVELERFAKDHNEDCGLYILRYAYGKIMADCETGYGLGCVRFSSPEVAKKAVEEIGADRLIKYYFGVVVEE